MAVLKFITMLGLFLLTTGMAKADWTLDMENSGLSFGSVKNGNIGESSHFKSMTGRITDKGEITLLIDLASVETWIDIRNIRMKKFFFQTDRFPVATLKGQIDMGKLKDLKTGTQTFFDAAFDFDLHGQSQTIDAELVIIRLTEKTVVVIPHSLVFLDVENFNLLSGLKKLQNLAMLSSISSTVPVIFHLTFNRIY